MTCAELRERLDAYAREALPEAEARAIEAHLSRCELCTVWLESEEPVLEGTARLPRSIEPDPAIWSELQGRLSRRGPERRAVGRRISAPAWVLAAAATILIVASAGVTAVLTRPGGNGAVAAPGSPLELQYSSATADLMMELGRARSRLDPLTMAVIERNLRVIDSALVESRRALAGDPGNQALEQLVVAAWRQKMDFLRRAVALAPAS